MKLITIVKNGKRIDMNEEMFKTWSDAAREAAAEARKKATAEIEGLDQGQRQDYWQHVRAGTPHSFAIRLAERQPQFVGGK